MTKNVNTGIFNNILIWLLLLTVILSLMTTIPHAIALSVNKWAVVWGDNGYGNLNICGDNNARLMVQALKSIYGFPASNIILLTGNGLTPQSAAGSLVWLQEHTDDASSVFYFYSGHGTYFAPETYVAYFNPMHYAKLVLIFEGCNSGDVVQPLAGINRVVIASAVGVSVTKPNSSTFGDLFIKKAILKGLGDFNRDGEVSMEEAFQYYPNYAPLISDGYLGELVP